jgi:hypothetical protein
MLSLNQTTPIISISLKGSCLCGSVKYEVTGTPTSFDLDHCSRCRKSSGSAFKAELILKAGEIKWVSGRSLVRVYEAPVRGQPPGYRRTFCGRPPLRDIRARAGARERERALETLSAGLRTHTRAGRCACLRSPLSLAPRAANRPARTGKTQGVAPGGREKL